MYADGMLAGPRVRCLLAPPSSRSGGFVGIVAWPDRMRKTTAPQKGARTRLQVRSRFPFFAAISRAARPATS